uniref:Uncharacterized protein n=1 Tax=Arundo donax TaxID=35708 RepID=A0A0A8ZLJ7_ARUDO
MCFVLCSKSFSFFFLKNRISRSFIQIS